MIDSPSPTGWDIAEAWALKARNVKAQWFNRLRGRPVDEARRDALALPELDEALETYYIGFTHNLNHFYSGLNALVLLRIRLDLARLMPEAWAARFESQVEAVAELEAMDARFQRLAGSVQLAIDASRLALARQADADSDRRRWTEISAADHAFVTAVRPAAVAQQDPAGPFWRSCVCSGRRPRTAEDLPDTGTAAALRGRRAWRPGAAGGAGGIHGLSGPTACCSSRATWSMRRDARNRASRPRPRPRRAG